MARKRTPTAQVEIELLNCKTERLNESTKMLFIIIRLSQITRIVMLCKEIPKRVVVRLNFYGNVKRSRLKRPECMKTRSSSAQMFAQELDRSYAMNHVRSIEIFESSSIADLHLVVEAFNLGVFECDPLINSH